LITATSPHCSTESGAALVQCAYDQQPAVVADDASGRASSGDPAAVPVSSAGGALGDSDIVNWFKTGEYCVHRYPRSDDPDCVVIEEAIQVLEHALLVIRHLAAGDSASFQIGLTRLGVHAVQTNTARQHLGLGDAPPTA
jgi:hypothetical protein